MAKRTDPRQLAKLARVQHVHRAAAEVALLLARDAAADAFERRRRADDDAALAAQDWLGCLNRPVFEPEHALALGVRLVARKTTADETGAAHAASCDDHARRQDDWRRSQARVELTDTMLKDARRKATAAREEYRLAQLSDRVTYVWTRP